MLLRHVHVNAIADYYDIPPLKELANTEIKHLLETSWSADGFSHVVKEVFDSTRDTALHNMVTSASAAHIEELLELDDFTALEVMSDFAVGIIRSTIAERKANEESSLQGLQATESKLKFEIGRAHRIIQNIDGCLDILSRTETCPNAWCRANLKIERGGPEAEPKYTLLCRMCRCTP
jgi:hypothetical protein